MYKFIKYKYKDHDTHEDLISQWLFVPQSEQDVFEFFYKYTMKHVEKYKSKLEETINNPRNRAWAEGTNGFKLGWKDPCVLYNGHPTNNWESAHQLFMYMVDDKDATEDIAVGMYGYMAGKMLLSRLDTFKKGIMCCFDEEAIVCRCLVDVNIVDTIEKEELVFPTNEKEIEQVRYIQWDGGKHWYAKIHNEDIVVDGEQKWNSKEEAENAVKKYFDRNK